MSDRLIVTAFIEGNDGKKRPQRIGTVVMKGPDKGNLYLTAIPVGKWDGSAAIEVPRDDGARLSGSADRRQPSAPKPSWGTSGHGNSAKHAAPVDDFGGYSNDADSDIPF